MNTELDWTKIAKSIGVTDNSGSFDAAKLAIEEIIGKQRLRDMVDHYIKGGPHSELVRNVLWYLHPQSAMDRCYEVYKRDDDLENRRSAIELLRVVADHRAIKWIREFLDDPDDGIQNWGVCMLDQLLFGAGVDPDFEGIPALLSYSKNHKSTYVRETYQQITEHLKQRGFNM